MRKIVLILFVFLPFTSLISQENFNINIATSAIDTSNIYFYDYLYLHQELKKLIETKIILPTKKENYYIAQGFQDPAMHNGTHLGLDITKKGTPNCDLGDTLYAITNMLIYNVSGNYKGYLSGFAKYKGRIIKIVYMHCDTIFVRDMQFLKVGKPIATIGNDGGAFPAHLHLEVITEINKTFGGYGWPDGFIDASLIIPKY